MAINTEFILASKSRSRISILKNLNLKFISLKHSCKEEQHKKEFLKLKFSPRKISLELSKRKAKSIKKRNKLIIGSDTVLNYKKNIFGKAKTLIEAEKKIKTLSGKTHTIISSAAAYYNDRLVWFYTGETKVKLRKLTSKEIKKYLDDCGSEILESTGCYQIEKRGGIIIEKIKGDFFNVMGMPIFPLLLFLKRFKIKK